MASGPFYVRRSTCNAASDTGNSHQFCVDQALNNADADRDSHDNGFHQDQKIRKQIDALKNTTSIEATALMQAEDLLRFAEKSPMLEAFDDQLFTRFVERIVIRSRHKAVFHLTCGLTLTERM